MTQEFCFRLIRIRPNRMEESEVALNQEGSKGFHVVGVKEFSNDFIVVLQKELVPTMASMKPYEPPADAVAPVAKRGPGRPKKE